MGDKKDADAAYEFRVWGKKKDAVKKLVKIADDEISERLDDWYLLEDDPSKNIKIRNGRLKIKRLQGQKKGFEHWTARWYRSADEAPARYGLLLANVFRLSAGQDDFGSVLEQAAAETNKELKESSRWRPLLVTKHRRRFTVGSTVAEATEVKIAGRSGRLKTLAIEGPNLADLVDLRATLKLTGLDNVALHMVLQPKSDL